MKGGEGWSQPFTSHNPSVYRGFRRKGEGWRVKLRVSFFPGKTTLPVAGKHTPNGDGRPPEIFLPTHHFAPGTGKKLPQLGAILCQSQAKSGMSLFSTRQDYHDDFPEAFRHLVSTKNVTKTFGLQSLSEWYKKLLWLRARWWLFLQLWSWLFQKKANFAQFEGNHCAFLFILTYNSEILCKFAIWNRYYVKW